MESRGRGFPRRVWWLPGLVLTILATVPGAPGPARVPVAIAAEAYAARWGADPSQPLEAGDALLPALRDTLEVLPGETIVCLSRSFVLASTMDLREGEYRLEAGSDYALDSEAGCIRLLGKGEAGLPRVLLATYRALPFVLQGAYRLLEDPHLRQGSSAAEEGASRRPASRPFAPEANTEGLEISGSQSFGIEVGNRRDLKLRQSLDVRLSGRVTPDVTLLAILSDQDIPFQPEGNTAELEELDKVLVELRAPRATAGLGDVEIRNQGMQFLDVDRRVEGFRGEARVGEAWTRAALASAKGEYASISFFGDDGRQGPYRLTDRAGTTGIVVIAGTEKIWIDGALLQRGEEEDYVVDYSLGEVTFTSRRRITANSRITMDYEYSTGRYRRRIQYGAADSVPLGPAGTLRAAWFQEEDDADNPLGGDLTDAERNELAALGDSAGTVSGGTRFVPDGGGDYKLVVDPESGREIFVYVDVGGDYLVTFVNIGEGKGNYEIDPEASGARTVYRFAGDGEGSYIVRRDLPAPQGRSVAAARWDLAGSRGALRAEGAVSTADRNLLSPFDDGDNDGGALLAEAELAPVELGGGITAAPRVRLRRTGENFSAPGRIRPAFYGRDWNLSGTADIRDEDLREGGINFDWRERLSWETEAGRLALADTFLAVRQRQGVRWNDRWVGASGEWLSVREDADQGVDGRLERTAGEIRLQRWAVQPRVRGLREVRRAPGEGAGERYREWEGALRFPIPGSAFQVEVGAGRRLDDNRTRSADPWGLTRDARRRFLDLGGNWRTLAFDLRYEQRRVEQPGGGNERRDVGRLDLRQQALRGAWTAFTTLDVSTVGLRRRSKSILPDANGYFDQFGNYVGAGGGYDVVYGDPRDAQEILTARVDLSTRMRWSPGGREASAPPWLQKVAWEGFVNLTESSTLPLGSPRYLFSPGSYLDRQSTLEGNLRARQSVDLFPRSTSAGLRLRQEITKRLVQNEQVTVEAGGNSLVEISTEATYTATLRANPSDGWTTEWEGRWGSRGEEVATATRSTFEQQTRLTDATSRVTRRLGGVGSSGRLGGEVTWSRERGDDREAMGWVLSPRAQWSWSGVGRVDLRTTWTELTRREGFTGIRGPGAPRLVEGWRIDLVGDVRVRKGISVTTTLAVDRPRSFDAITAGRVEVRGSF